MPLVPVLLRCAARLDFSSRSVFARPRSARRSDQIAGRVCLVLAEQLNRLLAFGVFGTIDFVVTRSCATKIFAYAVLGLRIALRIGFSPSMLWARIFSPFSYPSDSSVSLFSICFFCAFCILCIFCFVGLCFRAFHFVAKSGLQAVASAAKFLKLHGLMTRCWLADWAGWSSRAG